MRRHNGRVSVKYQRKKPPFREVFFDRQRDKRPLPIVFIV